MERIKMRVGNYMFPVKQAVYSGHIFFAFDFNRPLMEEIKALEGSAWAGSIKKPDEPGYREPTCPDAVAQDLGTTQCWRIIDSQHNRFQLEFLKGGDPYAWYDRPLLDFKIKSKIPEKPAYPHQDTIASFFLTYRRCLTSAETGIGKSFSAISAAEELKPNGIWWVSSVSGVRAVERELREWKATFKPRLMTYDRLRQMVKDEEITKEMLPQLIIFDEAHKIKTPTSQRSQAAASVADAMREKFGMDAYIWLMTGTPAPNNPTDWWHLCRVACPGFLREGTFEKFRARLAIIVARENQITGGMFPQLVSWLDCEDKCGKCGRLPQAHNVPPLTVEPHIYVKSQNEVARLYRRMKGLVLPMFKKDCLNLPDKRYEVIRLQPSAEMLNIARLIVARNSRTITRLTLLRELSDGFQYKIIDGDLVECPDCKGKGVVRDFVIKDDDSGDYEEQDVECWTCDGSCKVHRKERSATQIESPKTNALIELLDHHEAAGRMVTFAGFTESVEHCIGVSHSEKWATIRADGQKWTCVNHDGVVIKEDPLTLFQDMLGEYPRVNWCGHPESSGEGLTLTRSPGIVYYSNDFNFKSRAQSEDRIHRLGMDVNRGATIYDLCCLETDYMVLNNLRAKKRLQHMTLTGDIFA